MSSMLQEASIKELNIAFQSIVNQTNDVVFIKDSNGRFIFMNEAGIQLLDQPLEDIIGKDETELFGPITGFEGWESDHRVLVSGKPYAFEMRCHIQDKECALLVTKYPYTSPDGTILGVMGIGHDTSEKNMDSPSKFSLTGSLTNNTNIESNKETPLETNPLNQPSHSPDATQPSSTEDRVLNLSRTLLSLQSAVVAIASSLDLTHILDTLTWETINFLEAEDCVIFNWEQKENTVYPIAIYQKQNEVEIGRAYRLDDYPLFKRVLTERRAQQIIRDQLESTLPEKRFLIDSGIKSLLLLPMSFQDRVIGLMGIVGRQEARSYSDQEISLTQLLVGQAASSIVNARLYAELDETNTALKVSNEELDAFSHTVAHDLKGPIGLLMGFSEIIIRDGDEMPQAELHQYLGIINNNSQKMLAIINGLLMLASVRQDEVEGEAVQVAHYAAEAKERLMLLIEKHQAEIVIPPNLPVAWGYGPWIEEVWANYLSNAVKYGGRPPHIRVGATAQADGMIRYWVQDNGQGLTPEQQSQLFTPFTRLNQVAIEGHGLGLSIVQRIVSKLQGTVGVESEIGQGSTFFFTLPGSDKLSFLLKQNDKQASDKI